MSTLTINTSSAFRTAVKEALIIVAGATVLGFGFTGLTGKGVFSNDRHGRDTLSLTYDEARSLFVTGEALFIDARHTSEFGIGHIKGAISVPLQEFDTILPMLGIIPKNKMIVTYCDGAECNSSRELALKLWASGYTNIRVFFGGWNEWMSHNQPREP